MNEPIEVDIRDILKEIDNNLIRAGWSKQKARKYLIYQYHKTSRLRLTDEELLEFLAFTRQIPIPKKFKFKRLTFPQLPEFLPDTNDTSDDEPLF